MTRPTRLSLLLAILYLLLVVLALASCDGNGPEERVNTDAKVLWQDDDHRIIEVGNGCIADQSRWDDGSNWRTDNVACPAEPQP